jgi:hypothetical protein
LHNYLQYDDKSDIDIHNDMALMLKFIKDININLKFKMTKIMFSNISINVEYIILMIMLMIMVNYKNNYK